MRKIPAFLLVSFFVLPTFAADNSTTITSKDGLLSLRLPPVWKEADPKDKHIKIKAVTDDDNEDVINVFSYPKEDWDSLSSFAKNACDSNVAAKRNATVTGPITMEVGGKPAIRYDILYSSSGGNRYGFVMVCMETATRFNQFACIVDRSRFDGVKDECAKLASGLTENPPKKKD